MNYTRRQNDNMPYLVPIGVSARHVHLTKDHIEKLFGKDYKLNFKSELMGGQFSAQEQVTIVGEKLRAIENVRVLGPERNESQVEISQTDAYKLGIMPPVRDSGDLKGSSAISIVGPKGCIYLNEGCIIAKRHIHMSEKDGLLARVKDGEEVSVLIENQRRTEFSNVKIRIDKTYTLEMHIDLDEANASGIKTGDCGKIFKLKQE